MREKTGNRQDTDFGGDVAKIMPLLLRELARRQRGFFAKVALTVPQIVIIEFLAARGACKMKELARVLNFTMSAVTAIVDKMVTARLVKRERSSEDRRVVNVSLLHKGRQLTAEVMQLRRKAFNEMFSTLNAAEKNEYIRILNKVYQGLQKKR
jgi:DNA-binding MarR family transcriptional regulator